MWATQVVNGECSEEVAAHDPLCSFLMTKQPWVDSVSTLIPLAFCFQSSCPPTLSLCCLSACTHPGSAQTKAATTFHCFMKKQVWGDSPRLSFLIYIYFFIFSGSFVLSISLHIYTSRSQNRMLCEKVFFLVNYFNKTFIYSSLIAREIFQAFFLKILIIMAKSSKNPPSQI